jgi:excisionase family DNA binding protein
MKFYTVNQIAEMLDVSPRTVRRWLEKRLLAAHRPGRIVRISDADFKAFLGRHRDV